MIRPIIEFCMSNLASGSEKAKEKLERDPDLDIIEYGCLSNCGECAASLFAFVEGEVVTGEDQEALVENIYRYIKEHSV